MILGDIRYMTVTTKADYDSNGGSDCGNGIGSSISHSSSNFNKRKTQKQQPGTI